MILSGTETPPRVKGSGEESCDERRIFGPPGTGKTTALSAWIRRAAATFGGNVLVASFTRAAATELVGRDLPLGRHRVGTIHSLCRRAWGEREDVFELLPEVVAEWNRDAAPQHVVAVDKGSGADPLTRPKGSEVWREYHVRRARMEPRAGWPSQVRDFAAAFERFKAERGLVDFTEMVERVVTHEIPPPCSAEVVFLDEAQDCTALELAVMRQWAREARYLVMAGDDDQAIYGFRGATPEGFIAPIDPEHVTVLGRSYRLAERVRAHAAGYATTIATRWPKTFEADRPGGDVLREAVHLRNAAGVVDLVERHLDREPEQTVMVLASCDYLLSPTLKELRARGIPFGNPYAASRGHWQPMRGGVDRLRAYARLAAGEGTWEDAGQVVEVLSSKHLAHGAKAQVKGIVDETPEVRVTSGDWGMVTGCGWPDGSARWLADRVLGSALPKFDFAFALANRVTDGEAIAPGALEVQPHVIVGTVHSVKGGEADTVILGPDVSRKAAVEGGYDPDGLRRLFYVAMTRARHRLVLLDPCSRFYEETKQRW